MKLTATQQDRWPTINSNCKTPQHLHHTRNREVRTIWSSRLVIGCGRSTGDHVTRDITRQKEIPASQSRHWYHELRIDVTFLVRTLPIPVTRIFAEQCIIHIYLQTKMEQTECSETSAYKILTPGNYPKESIQHTEHGESLKLKMRIKLSKTRFGCGTIVRNFSGVCRAQHHEWRYHV